MGLFSYIFASDNSRNIKKLKVIANKVVALDEEYSKLTDEQLKHKTVEFKERLKNGETLNDILPEAFATVSETLLCSNFGWNCTSSRAYCRNENR